MRCCCCSCHLDVVLYPGLLVSVHWCLSDAWLAAAPQSASLLCSGPDHILVSNAGMGPDR
jgi:hypothetical protein